MRAGVATLLWVFSSALALAETCPDPVNGAALSDAKAVVRQFYALPELAELRGDLTLENINAAAPYLSAQLARDLAAYWEALALLRDTSDPGTKTSLPDGPIFHSNYEGMTAYSVFSAAARDDASIHVTLKLDYLSPLGSTQWADVVVLRCDAGRWALGDVLYDPEQTAGPSLTARIAVQ